MSKPIGPDFVYEHVSASAPRLSRDGRRLVFVETRVDREAMEYRSRIMMRDLAREHGSLHQAVDSVHRLGGQGTPWRERGGPLQRPPRMLRRMETRQDGLPEMDRKQVEEGHDRRSERLPRGGHALLLQPEQRRYARRRGTRQATLEIQEHSHLARPRHIRVSGGLEQTLPGVNAAL